MSDSRRDDCTPPLPKQARRRLINSRRKHHRLLLLLVCILLASSRRIVSGDSSTGSTNSGCDLASLVSPTSSVLLLPSRSLSLSWRAAPPWLHLTLSASDILPGRRGFVGVGFGSEGMVNVDLHACMLEADGRPVCIDGWSVDHAFETDQSRGGQPNLFNLSVASSVNEGGDSIVSFSFSRLLHTGDEWDKSLPSSSLDSGGGDMIDIVFSAGLSSAGIGLRYHGVQNRGRARISLYSGRAEVYREVGASTQLLHGISMLITWMIFYPGGAFVARYLKFWAHWLQAHDALQTAGSVGCVSFAFMALVNSGAALRSRHGVLGVVITALLLLQIGGGELVRWRLARVSGSPSWQRALGRAHRLLGIALVALGPYQCSLGIDLLWPGQSIARSLFWTALACIVTAFTAAELWRRFKAWSHARRIDQLVSKGTRAGLDASQLLPADRLAALPLLSWSDVSARCRSGSKLLVLGGLVLDVRSFLSSHPGGRGTLEEALGTDATDAFLGRDPSAPMHAHSAAAWSKIQTLVIAALRTTEEESETSTSGETLPQLRRRRRQKHTAAVATPEPDADAAESAMHARRINQLLNSRRLVSRPVVGESAHYRRYRLVVKRWVASNVLRLEFEQGPTHQRPFVWEAGSMLAECTGDLRIRMAGEDECGSVATSGNTPTPHAQRTPARSRRVSTDAPREAAQQAAPCGAAVSMAGGGGGSGGVVNKVLSVLAHLLPRTSVSAYAMQHDAPPTAHPSSSAAAAVHPLPAAEHATATGAAEATTSSNPTTSFNQARSLAGNWTGGDSGGGSMAGGGTAAAAAPSDSKAHILTPGEHLELQALTDGGEVVERCYTPLPCPSDRITLCVKLYPSGAMSRLLSRRQPGEYMKLRGPGGGSLLNPSRPCGRWERVLMLAGGSGVTPMIALAHHHLAANARMRQQQQQQQQQQIQTAVTAQSSAANSANLSHPPVPDTPSRLLLVIYEHNSEEAMCVPELEALERASEGALRVLRISTAAEVSSQSEAQHMDACTPHQLPDERLFRGRICPLHLARALQLLGHEVSCSMPTSPMLHDVSKSRSIAGSGPGAAAAAGAVAAPGGEYGERGSPFLSPHASPSARRPQPAPTPADSLPGMVLSLPPASASPTRPTAHLLHAPASPSRQSQNRKPIATAPSWSPALLPSSSSPHRQSLLPPPLALPSSDVTPLVPTPNPALSSPTPTLHAPSTQPPPRVFMCGPIEFMRVAIACLDHIAYDMQHVNVL